MNHPDLSEYTQRRAHTTWPGEHRGIRYSISFWDYRDGTDPRDRDPPHGIWNFYLALPEQQWERDTWDAFLAPESDDERMTRRGLRAWQYHDSALVDLDWPGGMTFYEVRGDAPYRWIKAGCDYNHSWDREFGYSATLRSVETGARLCVDSLLERYAPLVKCHYTGEYGHPGEMVETKWPGKYVLASVKDRVWDAWFEGTTE